MTNQEPLTATRLSAPHMTPIERQLYEQGYEEECQGFIIKPKRDFGRHGYWMPEHRCNINAGWVILNGSGRYRGCLATPGACWSPTLQQARECVADMVAAGFDGGSDEVGGGGDAQEFHRLSRERAQARQAASGEVA